jgi:hypothetical protein
MPRSEGESDGGLSAIANPLIPRNPMDIAARMSEQSSKMDAYAAQQAIGRAYQQAVDPNTGELDTNKLMSLAARDPRAAFGMPKMATEALGQQNTQVGIAGERLQQAFKVSSFMNSGLGALLQNPNTTHNDVAKFLTVANQSGAMPDRQYFTALRELQGVPPEQLRQYLQMHQQQGLQTMQQLEAQVGDTRTVDTGGKTIFYRAPAAGGPPVVTGDAAHDLSPGERIRPHELPTPGGGTTVKTGSQIATESGQGDLIPGGGRSGGVPSMRTGTGGGAGTTAGTSGTSGTGSLASGPSITEKEQIKASTDAYNTALQSSHGYLDRITPLERAEEALRTAKTGEGSGVIHSLASRLQTLSPDILNRMVNPRTPEEIAAFDEARKYLTRGSLSQPGATRSDAGEAAAKASSPSTEISPQAARMLVQAQIGWEKMKQAQILDHMERNPDQSKAATVYNTEMAKNATNWDPRAFVADRQLPEERGKLLDSMKPTEKRRYLQSVQKAQKYGLIEALQ